jgi:hypothetical protein
MVKDEHSTIISEYFDFHRKSWRETSNRSWGLFAHRASAPAAQASPNIAIIIRRLMKNLNKRGGKGMLPACCFPLWGREGVTLLAAAENKRITQKKRISTKPKIVLIEEPGWSGQW